MLWLKNLLFTIILPGTVGVYLPLFLAPTDHVATTATRIASVPLFAAGLAIYTWCVWDFATFGRGTPLPLDAPKKLVVRGLYRYTRNPMYVGVLTVVLGWAVWFRSPRLALYGAVVAFGFHLFVTLYEEPHLRRVFGTEYEDYCRRVGRWWPSRFW